MRTPYYQDEHVTLYHGDCLEVMDSIDSVDHVITDPPYSGRTHQNAKSNRGKGHGQSDINFAEMTDEKLRTVFDEVSRKSNGWVIATLDYMHAFMFENIPPEGLKVLRTGVWVKTNPMPQISADRPAQGWEAISYMWHTDKKPAWNGGGKHGNYILPTAQGTGHPTSKPVSMLTDIVEKFTKKQEIILDPFAGSGSTLLAARNLDRQAIGVELEEKYCELIAQRLSQGAFIF